jgi:hypothetical protein
MTISRTIPEDLSVRRTRTAVSPYSSIGVVIILIVVSEQNVYHIPQKKRRSKWLTIGLPLGLIVIAGAVVGVLFGLKIIKVGGANSSSSSTGGTGNVNLDDLSYFATGTNSYHQPLYPSMVSRRLSCLSRNITLLMFPIFFVF